MQMRASLKSSPLPKLCWAGRSCLYGGSVNPQNCEELILSPHIDGLFIGRSAWNVEGYLDILARCAAKL